MLNDSVDAGLKGGAAAGVWQELMTPLPRLVRATDCCMLY
jgi:hypothetical protein